MYLNAAAIVLSARRSGDKDKRLSLYTREFGRLFALAVGAARPGAKLGAATEPAVEARFRLWREGDALSTRVTGGGVENGFPRLRVRWDRMAAAHVLCEWTERLTPPADPNPEKYDLLRRALSLLETADVAAVRLSFMARFLSLAGYSPARDVPGLASVPGAADFLAERADDDLSEVPSLPSGIPAPYLGQQLLKFVAPLLHTPLRSAAHEEDMKSFQLSAISSQLKPTALV